MFDLTSKQQEDLEYLRTLENIVIPSEYTHWCHSTMYKPKEDYTSYSDSRCWNGIPTDRFIIRNEMSFVTRVQRINTGLDYGNQPSLVCANTANSLSF